MVDIDDRDSQLHPRSPAALAGQPGATATASISDLIRRQTAIPQTAPNASAAQNTP